MCYLALEDVKSSLSVPTTFLALYRSLPILTISLFIPLTALALDLLSLFLASLTTSSSLPAFLTIDLALSLAFSLFLLAALLLFLRSLRSYLPYFRFPDIYLLLHFQKFQYLFLHIRGCLHLPCLDPLHILGTIPQVSRQILDIYQDPLILFPHPLIFSLVSYRLNTH